MVIPNNPPLIVVGAGRWGLNLITTAHNLGALCAVVDTDSTSITRVLDRLGPNADVKFYNSFVLALAAHPTANVVVATPPNSHFDIAQKAIIGQRHVFVEKPLCSSLRDANSLVELAKEGGVYLMVDHLLQYSALHRRLIRIVKAGFVGDVTRVKMTRMNFGTVRTEENVLWSFTPHDVSILLSICGDELPSTVSCVGQKVVSSGVDDYIDMTLKFSSGIQAQIEASWMHPLKERRLIVYGTKGSLILNESMPDPHAPKLHGFKWSAKRRRDGSAVAIEKHEENLTTTLNKPEDNDAMHADMEKPPLNVALEHFLECINKKTKPTTDGEEGVRVLKVLHAATESLKKDGAAIVLDTGLQSPKTFVHPTAILDSGVFLGPGTKVWHFTHIMSGAKLGASCNIGQNVYIGGKATLGKNVKVQNNVSIYDAVSIADDVFLGPSCVLTNVKTPRSHVSRKHEFVPTTICKGVTVGANATIVCGVRLGEYSFVGAGAVVTKDVESHAMVYGNPATFQGWVSTVGAKLEQVAEIGPGLKVLQCSESKEVYTLHEKGIDGSSKPCVVRSNQDQ